jgi:hypothetical protein
MKWVALGCTYAMNTWSAWAHLDPALILLHSVPPAIVVCAAEAVTTLRHQITEAVNIAYRAVSDTPADTAATVSEPVSPPVFDTVSDMIQNTVADTIRTVSRTVSEPVSDTTADTVENTVPDTTADTVETVSDTAADTAPDTAEDTPPARPRRPAKRRGKVHASREDLARHIYGEHMHEHNSPPSVAELMRQLKDAGHPTGNKTAAVLLAEIKQRPMRLAQ